MNIQLSKIVVKIGSDKKLLFKIPVMEIKQGEVILIKGASGKGKTTFLHLLAGLFSPDEGSLLIGETELTKLSENERSLFRRKHMGIIFQKLNLLEHLSALENIQLSLKDQKNIDHAVTALNAVGLQGREHDRTSVMSLGEQQRVAVARVVAGDAHIVFADEPTSSLDEKNAMDVTELLIKSCSGKTLIVVSHDNRIEKYFTKVINFGELIA